MSSLDGTEALPHEAAQQPHDSALYPGDTGVLPEDARRVLVQLLAGPSLDGKRHTKLWPALLRFEEVIRSRLAEIFLELVLDRDQQVGFVRQADTGELEAPILLRRTTLTFLESALMLYLRQLLTEADAQGRRAVVSEMEMIEQMKLYERSQNTDRAGFDKRIKAAINKVKENSIISSIRGADDRYEISPTLKLLFSAEVIAALIQQYAAYRGDVTGESG
jgi:hypothetical protein